MNNIFTFHFNISLQIDVVTETHKKKDEIQKLLCAEIAELKLSEVKSLQVTG